MRIYLSILIFFISFSLCDNLNAQISLGGLPYSFINSSKSRAAQIRSNTFDLKYIDNNMEEKRAKEISESCKRCNKEYYGTGIDVSIDLKKSGVKNSVEGGTIWSYTFKSTSAYGLQFYFSDFQLPKKASLFLYNEDHSQVLGAFTHINNYHDNKFATEIIFGNRITLEYFEADDSEFPGRLVIYKVIHVFKNVTRFSQPSANGRFGDSGSCTIDVNCPDGQSYQNEKKAVCRISYYNPKPNLAGWCSGFLVNSDQLIRNSYLITADHCIDTDDPNETTPTYRFSEWIFEFDYEKSSCNSTFEPLTHSHNGATLVTRSTEADYALLDLNVNAIEDYLDVNYLGWDKRDNLSFSENVSISHPAGDVKKIAIDQDVAKSVHGEWDRGIFYIGDVNPKQYWQVTWDKGVTEGGSSGSPLINSAGLAIGNFSTGESACDNQGVSDFYSKFAYSWDKKNSSFFYSLGHYLDPQNKGTQILTSYTPNPVDGTSDSDVGGGTSGGSGTFYGMTPPLYYNQAITIWYPSYNLGNCFNSSDFLCSGNSLWRLTHGWRVVRITENCYQNCVVLKALSGQYTSGITRAFDFIKDKDYVLIISVYDPFLENHGSENLSISLTNNPPSFGCDGLTVYNPQFAGQQIMKINGDRIASSRTERAWYTFAIKFRPNNNYRNIYIEVNPKNGYSSSLWIHRVFLDERGNFNNPKYPSDLVINNSSMPNEVMANNSITVIRNGSTLPVVSANKTVKLQSHKVYLRDGFSAKYGSTFTARADDCLSDASIDNPFGPLEKLTSNGRLGLVGGVGSFITDYSSFGNIHSEPQDINSFFQNTSDIESGILHIVPNPSSSIVKIFLNNVCVDYTITLTTPTGEVLQSIEKSSSTVFELDLSKYSRGLYFIRIACANRILIGKVIRD